MRIVFMGTPEFAAKALERILQAGHNVVAVYTQPPKPVGRGYELTPSPTHVLAESNGIPVYYPKTLRTLEAQETLRALSPDICVVAAYGFILPKAVLEIPTHGCVNIHASLLPRWRGAAPIQHAILAGDSETGITLMKMDEGMDTGDMLYKQSVPITAHTTSQMLFTDLAKLGAEMIVEYLQNPTPFLPTKQTAELVTMAPKIEKHHAELNWNKTATELERQLRAFTPWPGALCRYQETVIKVGGLQVIEGTHHQTPGTVLNEHLHVACGEGTVIVITSLQRPGGKMMPTAEFLKGFLIKKNDSLA
jgi:methionyl-tRNA formyltransferase